MSDNSYNGNSNLKQIGFEIQYEPWMVQELLKCQSDPIYFIEKFCKIISLDHGLIPFKLYECQKEKVLTILNNRKVILMEGRQQGKTITSAACILHYTLFNESKTVAILANKSAAAREVLSRYQLMYENLPLWMQQGVKTWNKGDVELENGSKVFTSATSTSGIRGKSVNWLYIDEAAIIPNNVAEEFFTSTYPTIMAGETTKVLLSSTPLGYNHFWKFWNDAEQKLNDFVPLFIPYNRIPGRDEKWAAEQKAILGEIKFNQEVLCTFLGSSHTLISAEVIGRMSPKRPVFSNGEGLDYLEQPEKDHVYWITVDTSRGVGGDYSAFTVIDISSFPYKMVAKYRNNKISPLLYPSVIYRVANDFNKAHILLETNDIGQQVADILYQEMEYDHIVMVGSDSKTGQYLSSGFRTGSALGVKTSRAVKRIGCSSIKTLIENNKLLVHDADTIAEISTFVEVRETHKADEGYHDDLVMTLVLFGWAFHDPYFATLTNISQRHSIFEDQIKQIEEELTPFGFHNTGQEEEIKMEVESGDIWFTGNPSVELAKLTKRWTENI